MTIEVKMILDSFREKRLALVSKAWRSGICQSKITDDYSECIDSIHKEASRDAAWSIIKGLVLLERGSSTVVPASGDPETTPFDSKEPQNDQTGPKSPIVTAFGLLEATLRARELKSD